MKAELLRCSVHLYNLRPMGCDECECLAEFPSGTSTDIVVSGVGTARDDDNRLDKGGGSHGE